MLQVNKKVLIVEDDSVAQRALLCLLGKYGCTAQAAGTIADAIKKLTDFVPEWVLLDLMLPDGDGLTVLQTIRKQSFPISVCVMTASSDSSRLQRVHDAKPDLFMPKPVDFNKLVQAMSTSPS